MYHRQAMKRLINLYIIREISVLFLLGITVFTLILLMGRLIKLTDLVISRGVPLADVARMILYLMPSFLVFTIPMAFLLAVLLAFGRLSTDNEITVMKAGGISLVQLMPPVVLCALVTATMALAAGVVGVSWGNTAFKRLSFEVVKQNVTVTIREKVFWDDIPGIVLYTDHYDEEQRLLKGVIIHDGRDKQRPMTIFASDGTITGGDAREDIRLILHHGSIHATGKEKEYRLVNFGEYAMTIGAPLGSGGIGRNELDMSPRELLRQMDDPAAPRPARLKAAAEFHSRVALPFASLVFAVLAVPLGIQSRRSGKSAGFSLSIGILLAYYILLALLRTLAERGGLPPALALWLPNLLFFGLGWALLRLASQERSLAGLLSLDAVRRSWRKVN
ncbi:LPS export ABC transporter permease LptF [Geobacter sp. SVR]|uniref:LPS export ABC transporter permease LptF n=1 Tax=Geobacter sp. SVR TaxID=2495594 RepID=UPI001EF200B8|nr:LPS export ABC transporter permease LptF [Geobacter sp. SVR]